MANYVNGQKVQFSADVVQLRTKASTNGRNAGQFAIRCTPIPDINESGTFFRTERQMEEIAQYAGIENWKTLARGVARGGCRIVGVATFCKAGEHAVDNDAIVFEKDWFRVENLMLELSDEALEYIDKVTMEVDIRANIESSKENTATARKNRMAAMLQLGGAPATADDDDHGDDDDAVEEEEAPVSAPAKRKAAK